MIGFTFSFDELELSSAAQKKIDKKIEKFEDKDFLLSTINNQKLLEL